MNPTTPSTPAAPRRRYVWLWVLGACLTPFVLLGLAVASYMTLDRDAAALRRNVMSATHADWNTKVQVSIGGATLGAVRTGLWFVDNAEIANARLALKAVKHASVGVYELASSSLDVSREQLFRDTDRAMGKRGWTRLVGVSQDKEAVLVYVSDDIGEGDPIELCVAVVNNREMVVVSTSVDGDSLNELIERHAGDEFCRTFKKHVRL
ncbi:MAG: hypothetical protein C0502_07775 [Opitutus sp.]|nr:hypothetical protein [Opitutus sp.]